jgi:hypothetical protein
MTQNKPISRNAYKPSDVLIRHLTKRLQIEKKHRELTLAGEKLSVEDKRRRNDLIHRKVDVLNKHVFESMANIVYFLECCMDPQAQKIFDEDIEELLLGIPDKGTLIPVLARLLSAATSWQYKVTGTNNFRLKLFPIIQRIINQNILIIANEILGDEMYHSAVKIDLARVAALTEFLGKSAQLLTHNPDYEIHRPVKF